MGVTFTEDGAKKIIKATNMVLSPVQDRTGSRTPSEPIAGTFWGIITGIDVSGLHYTFLPVRLNFANDSRHDFRLTNGTAYDIAETEPLVRVAREASGNKLVPTYSVVRLDFQGYDADGEPAYLFEYAKADTNVVLPPHDHRSNDQGGFAFACYHPGTGIPQQPWAN